MRLVDVPAATRNDPRARSYIVDHLNPGTTIARRMQVQNNTDSAQSVRLYTGAAHINQGAFTVGNDAAPNELTTWTSVTPPQLEMAPRQQTEVLITVNVPRDAPESEQYAVVWAEVRSRHEANTSTQVSRVGIRIYLSVGPGNGPPTAFTIETLTASRDTKNTPEVTAMVTNTGGRALDMSGSLALANGPGDISAGPFPVVQGITIAPGSSVPVAVALNRQLPNGPWDATLALKSGLITGDATAQITFPDAGQSKTVQPHHGLNPLWIIAAAGLTLLIVATLLLWWNHRRKTVHTET